jgi:PAP2 superfamily
MGNNAAASTATRATTGWRGIPGNARVVLAQHGLFFAIGLVYLFLVYGLSLLFPSDGDRGQLALALGLVASAVPFVAGAIVLHELYQMMLSETPRHPIQRLVQRLAIFVTNRDVMMRGHIMAAATLLFVFAFTVAKAKITAVAPFQWDATFDLWDRTLHFGYRPWELLAPLLNYGPVSFALNFNYNMWFLVMNLFWVHYAFYAKPSVARTQFFLCFMLCWMLGGSVVAIIFSSAGPCYYALIGLDPAAYAAPLQHLKTVNETFPIWALGTQDWLWQFKLQDSVFGGIAAMPSLHNATALLFVLASWKATPLIRNLTILHCALVFLGSIHLVWHYAVDAYMGWAITLVIWFAVKPLARWWAAKEDQTPTATV